ncbi:hypothetical protein L7F22_045198 [Adiantum nelumboides]|nr:hypothetical protein [Adiantum nelumboides]MCO5591217.1 hypothetical protein [Adiantum nelumboides]
MACLCAPTTHEGSFRCRFHRSGPPPIASTSAQLIKPSGALPHRGALVDSCPPAAPSSDPFFFIRARESPSTHTTATPQQVSCNLQSSTSSTTRTQAASGQISPSPSRYARPPPAKRAISSSTSLSRSLYPGSSKADQLSEATRSWTGPSASHAAALAIMKQHLHHNNNKHSKSHNVVSGRNIKRVLRSSTAYKIGPSRLSRMSRACAEELPLIKKVECCTLNPSTSPSTVLSIKSASPKSDAPRIEQLSSKEATHINFKMPLSSIAKLKQAELSCKIVGYKAGPFIMSAVY